ncbi:cytochrome c oxidase protein 20, mitochondrial-like [Teratosphaeria destructans]|uniref:Cytochrome c oxidase assembly protein COX20, mitochondrial n=1 Tax=Teratosphaeria destructans TaxID=418781 RepID=A0A9W7STM7_9PEZI|nr:cytochrome c oxidase protein 20, mitochondrial-like [Teratosphaeria destructans]
MADDTRQRTAEELSQLPITKENLTVHPEDKPFTGQQWQGGKQIPYKPPENANMLAGGTEHTAGGKAPDVTFSNAFPKWKDFSEFHKRPCVRDSLLYGIGAGAGLGGTRFIWRCTQSVATDLVGDPELIILVATVASACNWAVVSFMGVSVASYQYCLYRRQAEKEGMLRAVEILNAKEMEKKAREARKEKLRSERRLAKEQEQDAQFAALQESKGGGGKPWWKVW